MNGATPRTVVLLAFLLVTGLAPPVPLAADGLDADELLGRIQGWLDDTRDLEGRFSQRLESGAFGDTGEESGRLWVERPGRMRWEYARPERKLAIVRDGKTWLYLAEEQQLYLGRLDAGGDLLPVLLAGSRRLADVFEATVAEPLGGEGVYRLRLVPRDAGDAFEEVVVTTAAPDFAVEAAEILDASGNRISYAFSRIRRNRGVNEDLFRFEPGPGVEVSGSHEED